MPVDVVEDAKLTRWLERLPERPSDRPRRGRKVPRDSTPTEPMAVFNAVGRPYSEDGLSQELKKLVEGLYVAGKLDTDRYGLHGLRHTRGVELAVAGCTDAQGAAMLGHGSPNSFSRYRKQADRIRLADDAAAKVQDLRERAANKRVIPGSEKVGNSSLGTAGERGEMSASSTPCDGTASPDRTGDLQSHNLAL